VAGVGVGLLGRLTAREVGDVRRVAGDAEPDVAPRAAVGFQRVVTAVALLGPHDVAHGRHRLPRRYEVVDGVRHVLDLENGRVGVDRDPVRGVAVEVRRQRVREGVLEESAALVRERAVGRVLGRRLP
jgi:hypothetical protein